MTQKKEVKRITVTAKQKNPIQTKSVAVKKANDCGCGCLVNQKK